MDITLRHADDAANLRRMIRLAKDAKQRDRLRCVALAIAEKTTPQIMAMLDRSRGFVQRWCYAYRDDGLDAVAAKSPPGPSTRLSGEKHAAFKQRVLEGPTQADGVCTLRGVDFIRILEEEYGVKYSLSGVYELLSRLGLSVMTPRPQHRKSDPIAMRKWKNDAPLLFAKFKPSTLKNKSQSGFKMKPESGSKGR